MLASVSPRRKYILREAGIPFRVIPSRVREVHPRGVSPARLVTSLALQKALAVSKRCPDDIVIGADTLVYINGHIIGKPKNQRHAVRILKELSGAWQSVYTGVAVVWWGGRKHRVAAACSKVKLKHLSAEEIKRAASQHLDKAGAYAVQEKKGRFVEKIKGDYDNVVGLPMRVVRKLLRAADQALHIG